MKMRLQDSGSGFDHLSDELGATLDEVRDSSTFQLAPPDDWEPRLNVYEISDRYLICAELADMRHNEIEVFAEAGTLHIRGHRNKPTLPDCNEVPSIRMMEIDSGRFRRKLPIPLDIDESRITARYRNGLLWITLPKRHLEE